VTLLNQATGLPELPDGQYWKVSPRGHYPEAWYPRDSMTFVQECAPYKLLIMQKSGKKRKPDIEIIYDAIYTYTPETVEHLTPNVSRSIAPRYNVDLTEAAILESAQRVIKARAERLMWDEKAAAEKRALEDKRAAEARLVGNYPPMRLGG